jgi:DNA-binding NarL/FixJ family response regulator
MPVVSGVEAIRKIHLLHPETRILVLTIFDHEMMIVEALEAGAKGYITKDSSKKQLFEAIETVYNNHPYYCRNTTTKLVRLISNSYYNPYEKEKKPLFTETEKKIVQLICEDKSVKEMSQALFMAERTVEKYRATVFSKMNVKTVAGVAIYAIKHRLYFVKEQ